MYLITKMEVVFVVVAINLKGCFQNEAKYASSLKLEIVSVLDQFFIGRKSIVLKSMNGRYDKKQKKIVIDNFSFLIDYDSTYASIPAELFWRLLKQAYCDEIQILEANI